MAPRLPLGLVVVRYPLFLFLWTEKRAVSQSTGCWSVSFPSPRQLMAYDACPPCDFNLIQDAMTQFDFPPPSLLLYEKPRSSSATISRASGSRVFTRKFVCRYGELWRYSVRSLVGVTYRGYLSLSIFCAYGVKEQAVNETHRTPVSR